MSCTELVEPLTAYLGQDLPNGERARFEAHLAPCQGCRIYRRQVRQTIHVLGQPSEQALGPEARHELPRQSEPGRADEPRLDQHDREQYSQAQHEQPQRGDRCARRPAQAGFTCGEAGIELQPGVPMEF